MNKTLFAKHRKMVEQTWIPIFVKDDLNTDVLLEGCALSVPMQPARERHSARTSSAAAPLFHIRFFIGADSPPRSARPRWPAAYGLSGPA